MKKTLCLFLALLMLTLVACDSADQEETASKKPAESKEESVSVQTDSPWSQLKSLAARMEDGMEFLSLPANVSSHPAYFVGEGELYTKVSDSYGGEAAEKMYGYNGTIASDGELVKIQYMFSEDALDMPIVFWAQGGKEYLEFPSLFEGEIYRADDVQYEDSLPTFDIESSLYGFDFPHEVFDILEKAVNPEETMTFSSNRNDQTYRLELDSRKARALFKELSLLLEVHGAADLMEGESSIVGQVSVNTIDSENHDCDAGVVEITSDGESYLLIKVNAMRSEKMANQLIINVTYTEDTKSYTVTYSPKLSEKIKLSFFASRDKLTIKGERVASAEKNKYDLTILAVGENEYSIEGTVSYSKGPDGIMVPITYVITGTFKETEESIAFDMKISLSMMGGYTKMEMGYNIRYGDVTLEFPYTSEDIKEFDEEEFYQRLFEVYQDQFGGLTTDFQCFLSEDESAMLILFGDGSGDLSCYGTYKKSGSNIKITILDGLVLEDRLTVSGKTYFLNGQALEVEEEEGIISLYYGAEDGSYPWGVHLYDDGTCNFFCAFYPVEDGNGYVFADGTPIPEDAFKMTNDLTLTFFGIKFVFVPGEYGEEL